MRTIQGITVQSNLLTSLCILKTSSFYAKNTHFVCELSRFGLHPIEITPKTIKQTTVIP